MEARTTGAISKRLSSGLRFLGVPPAARFGQHVLGYVRPWKLADHEIEVGSTPAMIASASHRGFHLISPIVVPSIQHGRDLLRRLRDEHGIVPAEWRCYHGEYPAEPIDKLFLAGSGGVRTDLEHELTQTFGPKGQARQAFTRPDALAG